jgi:hypothetical protein
MTKIRIFRVAIASRGERHEGRQKYHIQEMLHLRQELSRRYEALETQLATPSNLAHSSLRKVCGLIEQEDLEPSTTI